MPATPPSQPSPRTVVVDASNVIGATAARGERWWRDRSGATRRLLDRLIGHARATGGRIVLVLDFADPSLPEGSHGGVEVVAARRRGRDAADDRIRELLAELPDAVDVEVITSDRRLADDARAAGATVTGAGTFLARLDASR